MKILVKLDAQIIHFVDLLCLMICSAPEVKFTPFERRVRVGLDQMEYLHQISYQDKLVFGGACMGVQCKLLGMIPQVERYVFPMFRFLGHLSNLL